MHPAKRASAGVGVWLGVVGCVGLGWVRNGEHAASDWPTHPSVPCIIGVLPHHHHHQRPRLRSRFPCSTPVHQRQHAQDHTATPFFFNLPTTESDPRFSTNNTIPSSVPRSKAHAICMTNVSFTACILDAPLSRHGSARSAALCAQIFMFILWRHSASYAIQTAGAIQSQ